jgi:NAD(P)-dependent dehydrogenase (short-subunit alcohol dehydrogenase family)
MSGTLLAGKNALITGASRGLGREIARAMWRQGANLLLVARTEAALFELRAEFLTAQQMHQQVHVLAVDLAQDAAPKILDRAGRIWDRVDILVNNSAVLGPIGNAWENDWDEWQATIRVDLLAVVELCCAFVPWMIERGSGKIINLSGGGATAPRARFSAYATAKAALVRFSETLAEEVRGSNVQVNCVAPGALNTEMNRAVLTAGSEKAGMNEHARAVELASGGGTAPTRAADLCVFLASSAADGITGRLISAVWDPWPVLAHHVDELQGSDIYTLRRIVPKDRGKDWE